MLLQTFVYHKCLFLRNAPDVDCFANGFRKKCIYLLKAGASCLYLIINSIFLHVEIVLRPCNVHIYLHKVCPKKKFTRVCLFYINLVSFFSYLNINPKCRHSKDSKMVRQVHIVPKLLPGSMINHKNYFWEITKFVKKLFAKKGDLAFLSIM